MRTSNNSPSADYISNKCKDMSNLSYIYTFVRKYTHQCIFLVMYHLLPYVIYTSMQNLNYLNWPKNISQFSKKLRRRYDALIWFPCSWFCYQYLYISYYVFVNFDEIVYIYVCICCFNCTVICNNAYIYNFVNLMNVFLACWRRDMTRFTQCWPFVRGIPSPSANNVELWCFPYCHSEQLLNE